MIGMKKKICISFEHLVASDGVSRSAIAIANLLDEHGYDVTLVPLFRIENKLLGTVNSGVHLQKVFGFYFHGFAQIVDLFPDSLLYWWIFKRHHYDLEIAFQKDLPIKIIGARCNDGKPRRLAWIHTYDEGLALRKQYERIGKVICVSKQNSDRLSKELPSVVSDYSYNPIDEQVIIEQSKESIDIKRPSDCPLFVSVGRHSPEKGYIRLLDIIARLRNEGYKMKLWLIGGGVQHDELIDHSNRLGLQDIVYFTGQTSNPHKYTVHGDIFVCSSYREGYSTACTESIMLGIPVITTNVGGSREIIEDSGAGIHCDIDDESLYKAIKKVLDNPILITKWKNVLETNKNKFSQRMRTQKLFKIVEEQID